MKILVLSALAFCTAVQANASFQCDDCMVPQVVCQEASTVRDAGYSVSIESGGFAGLTFASVSRISIAGALPVLTEPVAPAATRDSKLVVFQGDRFGLVIDRAREVKGYAPAVVKFSENGAVVKDDLLCSFR